MARGSGGERGCCKVLYYCMVWWLVGSDQSCDKVEAMIEPLSEVLEV